MNPSYFRIKLNMEDAVRRLERFNGTAYKEKIPAEPYRAASLSLGKDGQWKGLCLYVYENKGWTVFEDLSGGYCFTEAKDWKEFAAGSDFVFAAYNDAIFYAELIVVENGIITKNFMENDDIPEENRNEGDAFPDITDWMGVADFMDDDPLVGPETGTLYIY